MKGFFLAALIALAFPTVCPAADPIGSGIIVFTGAVIGDQCALKLRAAGGLTESCPQGAVSHTLSVQTVASAGSIQAYARPVSHTATRVGSEQPYTLETANGVLVTHGRYVITQNLL